MNPSFFLLFAFPNLSLRITSRFSGSSQVSRWRREGNRGFSDWNHKFKRVLWQIAERSLSDVITNKKNALACALSSWMISYCEIVLRQHHSPIISSPFRAEALCMVAGSAGWESAWIPGLNCDDWIRAEHLSLLFLSFPGDFHQGELDYRPRMNHIRREKVGRGKAE